MCHRLFLAPKDNFVDAQACVSLPVASHEVPVETATIFFLPAAEALESLASFARWIAWNASEIMSPSVLEKAMCPSMSENSVV